MLSSVQRLGMYVSKHFINLIVSMFIDLVHPSNGPGSQVEPACLLAQDTAINATLNTQISSPETTDGNVEPQTDAHTAKNTGEFQVIDREPEFANAGSAR
jgi:hypothetical protein